MLSNNQKSVQLQNNISYFGTGQGFKLNTSTRPGIQNMAMKINPVAMTATADKNNQIQMMGQQNNIPHQSNAFSSQHNNQMFAPSNQDQRYQQKSYAPTKMMLGGSSDGNQKFGGQIQTGSKFSNQHNTGEFGFKISSNKNHSKTAMYANAVPEGEIAVQGDTNINQIDNFMDQEVKKASGGFKEELIQTARAICQVGKGILATDESNATIGKRFEALNVENTHENRQKYRELMYTTPYIENYVSGVIMYDETARDTGLDGSKTFIKTLQEKGIQCGIKVDVGLRPIPGTDDESATHGLDGLNERCAEYYALGCRFAKWRAVLKIGDGLPSDAAIQETAHSLARYGAICQANGIVPIIEPEILTDGSHGIEVCAQVTEKVLTAVMKELQNQNLLLEGLLLKPNMVTPGALCEKKASPEEIAYYTLRTFRRTVLASIPGITFLSGGQSEELATQNLNAIAQQNESNPWHISFSYGRALQDSVLKTWNGKEENVKAAQELLMDRARANGLAQRGLYQGGSGGEGAKESLYVADYKY